MAKGYFEIRFKNQEKENDGELRQKVVDYCKNNYAWFAKGIEDGQINVDGALKSVNNMGLVESEVPDEALTEDWIRQIGEEFHPWSMRAIQLLGQGEFQEGPFSYRRFSGGFTGSRIDGIRCKAAPWDWTDDAVVEIYSAHDGWLLEQSESLGNYYAAFKNKVNGQEVALFIYIKKKELYASNQLNLKSYLLDENGARISRLDNFDHFDEKLLNTIKSYCQRRGYKWNAKEDTEETWEFLGMKVVDYWDR